MTKLIIFVIIAIVAQVIATYKKSQDEARRRAQEADRLPGPRPVTRRTTPVPPPDELLDEDEIPWEPAPTYAPVPPAYSPPPPRAVPPPAWTRTPARHTSIVPATTPLAVPETTRRPALRLDRRRARAAIVLSEVIGPPVALRER